jgi:hypothetical protein
MRLWFVFAGAVVVIAIFGIAYGPADQTDWAMVVIVSAVALAPLTVFFSLARKPLQAEDHLALREEFRSRFFMGIGPANVPAVLGLLVLMSSSSVMPFLVLVAISLILLVLHAPSEANVRRADDHLRARHAPVLLSEELVGVDGGGS